MAIVFIDNYSASGVASMDFDPQSGMLFVGDLKYSISCVDVKNAALKKVSISIKGNTVLRFPYYLDHQGD